MNKLILGLLVVAVGIAIGWYILGGIKPGGRWIPQIPGSRMAQIESPTPTGGSLRPTPPIADEGVGKGGVAERTVVTYSDSGFSPASVTVKSGTMVAFMNDSSGGMWVVSEGRGNILELPGLDQLRSVGKGGSFEYQFTKVGTWKYHNSVKATDTGTIVVTQ